MSARLHLDLSVPPSANDRLTVRPQGDIHVMTSTAAYRRWKKAAMSEIMAARAGWATKALSMDFRYAVRIRLSPDDEADINNREKALVDAIVSMGVTPDDRQLYHLSVGISPSVPAGRVHVRLWSVNVPIRTAKARRVG